MCFFYFLPKTKNGGKIARTKQQKWGINMEAKQYIRTYEQLKNEGQQKDVEQQFQLERKWIMYYKEVDAVLRKMTKKQKAQLLPFKEKALKETKDISAKLFFTLTQKKENEFHRLLKKETPLYFKKGVRGLLETIDVDTQAVIKEKTEKEAVLTLSGDAWEEKISQYAKKMYTSLTEAYQTEKELISLFAWWNHRKVGSKSSAHGLLCRVHQDLITYILKELGYSVEMSDVFETKAKKNMLRTKGFIHTLQTLEQDGLLPAFEGALFEKINFIHPRDEFQSVRAMKRHFVLHIGPTNSGKTYHAIEALKKAPSGIYLAPIRLLALEIQEKLMQSNVPCTLITGEEEQRMPGAKHQSSTIEITNFKDKLDVAVIDEIQMIQDPHRGAAWLRALFGLKAREIHLCGAQNSVAFITKLIEECGDTYEVHHYERQTDLIVEQEEFSFPYSAKKGDAFVVFGKKKVVEAAHALKQAGYQVSIMYGKLPSDTRKKQVELFAKGENDVIVTTDAIGIGLNLPIQRIIFLETKKFDGTEERPLTTQEVKQIAGRAGRKGMYEQGYVNSLKNKAFIQEKLEEKEEDIQKSIIAPTPQLTEVKVGTLRQRFMAWSKTDLQADYLEKADITRALNLLHYTEKWAHELSDAILFKTLYVSFDYENKACLSLWKKYIIALKEEKTWIEKPTLTGKTTAHLETYYHQLNLYQQFSKKFGLRYAYTWVKEEKRKVAVLMNHSIYQNTRQSFR